MTRKNKSTRKPQAAADQENARLRSERQASGDGMTASERAMAQSAGKRKSRTAPNAPAPAEKPARSSGLNAACQVLQEAGEPLRCQDMVQRMLAQGLWTTHGKTPAATLSSAILREIKTKGTAARFKKTDRGRFALATPQPT